jgi:DivIVA domain-containing protein
MSFIKRHRAATAETPEQTIARLAAGSAATDQLRGPRFTVVNVVEGYDIAEVDAFIDTIDQRTADEVRGVLFSTVRLRHGYNEDEVDRFLDERAAQLAGEVIPDPSPPPKEPVPHDNRGGRTPVPDLLPYARAVVTFVGVSISVLFLLFMLVGGVWTLVTPGDERSGLQDFIAEFWTSSP